MGTWKLALELDSERNIVKGSNEELSNAIRAGADLRISTLFRHEEHIVVGDSIHEDVTEVAEFGVTHLVNDHWVAGNMSLRQPLHPPLSFHGKPSMSYFLYNQNGQQAIARPFFKCPPKQGEMGSSVPVPPEGMPKYHLQTAWDAETNAPSENFIYDFGFYRYFVNEVWEEVLSHDANGNVIKGSVEALKEAFLAGDEVKLGIRDLCSALGGSQLESQEPVTSHEIFIQGGTSCFNHERGIFSVGTHPLVRIKPNIPMMYESENWDFGWVFATTGGHVSFRRCDPYTLKFKDLELRHAMRWFVKR